MKKVVSFFILFASLGVIKAQDLIYLNNGNKFTGIVTEINTTDIKYKNENNPTGPTYVISKGDVLFIEYKNGSVEVINKNPQTLSPHPANEPPKVTPRKNPNELYYLNKNSLMINGMALANADITLLYDREFLQSHLSVTVLGGWNFNRVVTIPNAYIGTLAAAKKNYDAGLGINFYPSVRRKTQYFVGLLFKYMNYSYDKEVITEEEINGFLYQSIGYQRSQGYQFSTMVVNGFQFRLTPSVNFKIFAGIGGFRPQGDLKNALLKATGVASTTSGSGSSGSTGSSSSGVSPGVYPKMYLGVCFGYRF